MVMSYKEAINMQSLPRHIAMIMDGNGRWAKEYGLERTEGHLEGTKTVKKIVSAARALGLRYLTLYTFSLENWNRPREEVETLMDLFSKSLKSELPLFMENDIRLRVIGDISRLRKDTREDLMTTLAVTEKNSSMDLVLAMSYGGRWEILNATRSIVEEIQEGLLRQEDLNEEVLSAHMNTCFMPDPDLVIRTSGEYRISNFLLWQSAYSEFYFSPKYWPAFTEEDFYEAIVNYQQRERRFGKTSKQISSERADEQA